MKPLVKAHAALVVDDLAGDRGAAARRRRRVHRGDTINPACGAATSAIRSAIASSWSRRDEWTAHPAARRPQDVMLVMFVIAIAAYAMLVGMQSAWLAAIAVVMLVVAIAPFADAHALPAR